MTREEVYQVYYLNKEIEMWQRELQSLREGRLPSSRLTGMPRSSTQNNKIEADVIKIEEAEERIRQLLFKIQLARAEIYNYIATLSDSLIRQIIMYRCISLCTWRETAKYIGGSHSAESVRKVFNRHFRKKEEKN